MTRFQPVLRRRGARSAGLGVLASRRSDLLKLAASAAALLAAVTLLVVGGAGPALAAPPAQDPMHTGVTGLVTAKSANSFSVWTEDAGLVSIIVKPGTTFASSNRQKASFNTVSPNSNVAVLAEGDGATRNAIRVMVISQKSYWEHRVLTVVGLVLDADVSRNAVVAQTRSGDRVNVDVGQPLGGDTRGQLVTFVTQRSSPADRFTAAAVYKNSQDVDRIGNMVERLDQQIKETTDGTLRARKRDARAQAVARLVENMGQRLDTLAIVAAKTPEDTRAPVVSEIDTVRSDYEARLRKYNALSDDARTRLALRQLSAPIKAMDPGARTVTLTYAGSDLTFRVTDATQVLAGSAPGTLTDVSLAKRATVWFKPQGWEVAQLRAETEAQVWGTIQSLDARAGQLELGNTGDGKVLALNLVTDSQVTVNGAPADAGKLEPGIPASVTYDVRNGNIIVLHARTQDQVEGVITKVDTDKRSVTIVTGEGNEITVRVTEKTRVAITSAVYGEVGLAPGMQARALFNLKDGEAIELTAAKVQQ